MKKEVTTPRCVVPWCVVIAITFSMPSLYCGDDERRVWPQIPKDATLRFIRLSHKGKGWDDGMNESKADANFLAHLGKVTGLKTSTHGESIEARLLPKFSADGFPPFLYVTGNDTIEGLTPRDVKTIREYCLKGGMLIADAGSPVFDRSFRNLIRMTFPDKKLTDIADDDMLYKQPYTFSKGPPEFWNHGGKRPLGIKHEGRWIVFYHPGDMNDAWKSDGHVEITPEKKKAAMQLGVNVLHYSFTQWSQAVKRVKEK